MSYYSLVRILLKPNKYDLDNFRRFLINSECIESYLLVYEISPDKEMHHIHACIRLASDVNYFKFNEYLLHHRFKAYIDDLKPCSNWKAYTVYMLKTIKYDSQERKDYLLANAVKNEHINFTKALIEDRKRQLVDDPFLD